MDRRINLDNPCFASPPPTVNPLQDFAHAVLRLSYRDLTAFADAVRESMNFGNASSTETRMIAAAEALLKETPHAD